MFTRLITLLLLTSCLPAAVVTRIGDAGSQPDPSRFDPRFPEMAEWAKAGVSGGVPEVSRIVGSVQPGDDLQAAIDAAPVSAGNHGVLVLQPGEHAFDGVIKLKQGLVLRGADRKRSILVSLLNEAAAPYGVGEKHAVQMASNSGLEDCTVLNGAVRAIDESVYQGQYKNPGAPKSGLVKIEGKVSDCWVQRCDLVKAGSNPISIHGKHVTIRDCLIEKAHNKGGKGHGYLELGGAKYVLFYDCDIRDIRHVSIMWKSQYMVMYGCRLNVDINYHDGLPSHCLVEKTTVNRRGGHHWSAICFGWPPWQDEGPGPRCFLWNNQFDSEGGGDAKVWVLRDTTGGYDSLATRDPMILDFGPPPAHGTLYAVTGQDISYEQVLAARSVDQLEKAYAARAWPIAVARAHTVEAHHPEGSEEHARAVEIIAELEAKAAEALVEVLERPDAADLRAFLDTWDGTPAAEQARAKADALAAAAYAELGEQPSERDLRRFLADWYGIAAVDAAQQRFDQLAEQEFAAKGDRLKTPDRCRDFMADWPNTGAADKAQERMVELLRGALGKLKGKLDRFNERQRKSILQEFVGTPVEAEARELLE